MMCNQNKIRTVLLAAAGALAILTGCGTAEENQGAADSNAPVITTPVQETQPPVPTEVTVEPTATVVPTPTPFVFLYSEDKELSMAYEKGFVPVELWNTMDEEMSLGDFCSMIRNIVAEMDESVLAEFDSYMGNALLVEKPADRSLASIAMYYGTSLLKVPEFSWFSLLKTSDCWAVSGPEANDYIGEKVWDEIKNRHYTAGYFNAFPRGGEGGTAWDMYWDGDVSVAAYFAMLEYSTVDGRTYFDYDYENDTFHMDYPVTCEEGIRAATRFLVVCRNEEYFNEGIREVIDNSSHNKKIIEEYDINDLVDSFEIGIHFNHAACGLQREKSFYTGDYDSMYDVLLEGPHAGRDSAKAVLKEYKEKGFNVVHIPINWLPSYNPETKEIAPWFLDYVEYWVNLVLDEGFYCIISDQINHENTAYIDGKPVDNWMEPEYKEVLDAQLTMLWTQIAERFKDYDERVMFKPFVEPQQAIFPEIGTGAYEYQAKRMNELNQIVLDAVRSVGGNSEKRPMILGPLWGQFFMETMIPPEDDYVMAYYHTYFSANGAIGFYDLPSDAVPMNEKGEFTRWEKDDPILNTWVDRVYEQIRAFKENYDIPLIIGEFAPSLTLPEEDRIYMTTYVMQKAHGLGCPIIFWDGYFGDNGELDTGFYLLGTDEWRTSKLFDAIFEEVEHRKNVIGN